MIVKAPLRCSTLGLDLSAHCCRTCKSDVCTITLYHYLFSLALYATNELWLETINTFKRVARTFQPALAHFLSLGIEFIRCGRNGGKIEKVGPLARPCFFLK